MHALLLLLLVAPFPSLPGICFLGHLVCNWGGGGFLHELHSLVEALEEDKLHTAKHSLVVQFHVERCCQDAVTTKGTGILQKALGVSPPARFRH